MGFGGGLVGSAAKPRCRRDVEYKTDRHEIGVEPASFEAYPAGDGASTVGSAVVTARTIVPDDASTIVNCLPKPR